jgi:hypothetical protein
MPPHCDSLDGPVVTAARQALDAGDVDVVLPYVSEQGEPEVRAMFATVLPVRGLGEQAREVADRLFFETVVRIHRAGEGAPYIGLKPAGLSQGPVIPLAERAVTTGSPRPVAPPTMKRMPTAARPTYRARLLRPASTAATTVTAAHTSHSVMKNGVSSMMASSRSDGLLPVRPPVLRR